MPAKIAVIYSSTYGHVRTLAEAEAAAVKEAGAEVQIFQFPEILSDEVLQKMHAAPKSTDHPVITAAQLPEFDGFLFGIPTRYGRAVGCASAFFDQTGGLWATGALFGKFAGIFTCSASQHGGQETTALTTIPFFAHHGISFVPIGFAAPELTDNSLLVGGSAYGAAGIAGGDGSRPINEKELSIAAFQGKNFANLVNTFVAGKTALANSTSSATPASAAATTTETPASEAPVAAKALPATAATSEATPYTVDPTDASKGGLAAAPATTAAPSVPTATATKPAAPPAAQKSSGGLFSCCGGSGAAKNFDS